MDQTITYIIIIVVLALIILLIGVTLAYLRMVKKYLDLKEFRSEEVNPQSLIHDASEKAQRILANAQEEARETISKAQDYLNVNQNLVAKELERTSQIYAKKYEEILLATQDKIINMTQNIPNDVKKILVDEISRIQGEIRAEVEKATAEARVKVSDAYKRAEAEVENYKSLRMREIDERLVIILKEVARKVLAKEINQEEHEKLVLKALEEAKRQGVFGSQNYVRSDSF